MPSRRWLLLLALVIFAALPASASAGYQRGAAYANWTMPGAFFTNWEQPIVVTTWNVDTFWNIYWTKIYGPDGYLGIQTPSGTNMFHFSMWGATGSQAPSGGSCTRFYENDNLGYTTGLQCDTPVGTTVT